MSLSRSVRRPRRELVRPAPVGLRNPHLYFERLEDRLTPITTPDPLFISGVFPATGAPTNQNGAPLAIVVADINGDGRDDFAGAAAANATVLSPPRIEVYLSDGPTGKGYTPAVIQLGGANLFQAPLSLAAVDATSDGKAEIGSYSSATGNIRVDRLENTGTFLNLFTTQLDFELANGIPDPAKPNKNLGGMVGGDFNGDGKGDFIVTLTGSTNNQEYFVLLNNGNGKNYTLIGTPLKTGGGVSDYQKPVAADFDGDGNLDFAMLRPSNNQVLVMFGDGAGSFSFARALGVAKTPTALAVGDFDGNGKVDLAVGQSDGRIALFLKDPTSNTFSTKASAAFTGTPIVGLSAGDFDLDNIDDVAVVSSSLLAPPQGIQNVDVFLGRANVSAVGLTLAPGSSYGPLVGIGGSVATGDFDGNGNPDFVVGEGLSTTQQFTPFWNQSLVGGEVFLVQDTALSEFGQPVTYTVTVVPPPRGGNLPTGTVQFFEVFTGTQGTQTFNLLGSNPLAPAIDQDGSSVSVAEFAFDGFPVGPHTVIGKYLGDGTYPAASSAQQSVNVTKATTITTVTTPVPAPVFGQPVPLFANVISFAGQNPTGDVVFFDNGSLIGSGTLDANGQATITVSNFVLGAHSLQARFLGATSFNESVSNGVNLTVARANSTVSIAIDKSSAIFGDVVVLSSTVGIASPGVGVPTGTVEYYEGNTKVGTAIVNIANGTASVSVSGLTVGGHTFTAKYLGNSSVAASQSGTVSVTVDPTQSQASLVAVPDSIQLGTSVTLNAIINDTMTPPRPVNVGTVTFTGTDSAGNAITVGPVGVVNGVATATVAGLPLGNSSFTATFSGTESITPSVTNAVAVFTDRAVPSIAIGNSAGTNTSVLGKSITFTATYSPSNGLTDPVAGTATFLDNGLAIATVPLVNGAASVTTRLALGSHTITVSYSGSPTYNSLTNATAFTVTRVIDPIAVGAGTGGTDIIRIYNPDGTVKKDPLFAFGPDHTSGARIGTGDVNGDGVPDTVIGTGPGTQARIRVLDGATDVPLFELFPFEGFTGGVFIAVGDLTGDLRADLVVSPDQGGGPRVTVIDGSSFKTIANFFGIDDKNFRGGARVAMGDINGDSVGDLVVAAGFGGGPRVATFDGRSVRAGVPVKLFNDFFAFEQTLRNGVFVAAGDVDGDGFGDIVLGGGPGGGPRVIAVSGAELLSSGGAIVSLKANFFSGDSNLRNGVPVAVRTLDGDARADIVTGSGPGGRRVNAYLGKDITPTNQPVASQSFDAFDENFNPLGGVFVG